MTRRGNKIIDFTFTQINVYDIFAGKKEYRQAIFSI